MATYERFVEVFYAHMHSLLRRPGVNAMHIGPKRIGGQETDQLAIVIAVDKKVPESELNEEQILTKDD